ncbi:MgtC/SapB family protein [Methylobacterium sp. Leaf85]|uniref:MgtC/SapB family protein n=1 Tax=Methylobacterium sp. Leaf85 TaxID=1736241 RepID=UPI000B272838|nr:MgtC/SapB family protein [Methylobacterium sp. Leaf85]
MIGNFEILGRLLLAALLGSAVDFERERLVWAAGMRTHMLVCVGSCLIVIVSAFGFRLFGHSRYAERLSGSVAHGGAGGVRHRLSRFRHDVAGHRPDAAAGGLPNPALERCLIQSEETNNYLAGITREISRNKQSYTWAHLRDSCG